MKPLSGVLLVDKPVGPTSHDVVAAVRRASRQRKAGHAGTLDPLASGLLIVCLGAATRITEYLTLHDKVYEVEARLGVTTDTYDAEGQVTSRYDGPLPDDDSLREVIGSFCGEVLQTPPAFSAVKVEGVPLHRRARRGELPDQVPPRRVVIQSIDWTRPERARLNLRVHCSSGTYIRSLVHDIGRALGCGAHVTALRRTVSGSFSVEQALPLEEVESRLRNGDYDWILDVGEALPDWPRLLLDGEAARRLAQGQAVVGPQPDCDHPHLVASPSGSLFAIAEYDQEQQRWRPTKVLAQESDA
ncbi:MAG: tRNA pseudouridine(55) synthase TruB [Anaerolineae bacterium]|jgi:tRNA pseudouridine55 synthase